MYPKPNLLQFLFIFQFSLISLSSSSTTNSSDLLYDVLPFIRVYKNGTVLRLLGTDILPALDPTGIVLSKDIYLDLRRNISARLYLPAAALAHRRRNLPLLVYYHGGAFFCESPFSPTYHNFLNSLVATANVVAVSVNYRLAPENPLPIAFQDGWEAFRWAIERASADPWLRSLADYRRVYVGGDSAGGTIAHNVALRVGLGEAGQVGLAGVFLNCPYFWGASRIGNESGNTYGVGAIENIWVHAYPNSTGFDDPYLNPVVDPNFWRIGSRRVLVYVAGNDVLKDRGVYYGEKLRGSRWGGKIKVVEAKGQDHVFNLRFPNTNEAKEILVHLASFFNGGQVS